jgi:hypothetical protein
MNWGKYPIHAPGPPGYSHPDRILQMHLLVPQGKIQNIYPATLSTQLQTWYDNLYVVNKNNYVEPIHWCIGSVEGYDGDFSNECSGGYGYFVNITTNLTAVGLLNVSDYINASDSKNCIYAENQQCSFSSGITNYLYKYYSFWFANYAGWDNYIWRVYDNGNSTYSYPDGQSSTVVANTADISVRPAINIKANVTYKGGFGTLKNPYVLN